MEDNFYAVPKVYGESVADKTPRPDFYVVSSRKFIWLYALTMGLYGLYWNYKNWQIYREKNGLEVSPFWRAVFSVFFTHDLFRRVDEVGRRTPELLPNALAQATPVVLLLLASTLPNWLAVAKISSILLDLAGLLLILLVVPPMLKVQKDINAACGDPEGLTNSRFTTWNFLWMILGAVLWVSGLYGVFAVGPV